MPKPWRNSLGMAWGPASWVACITRRTHAQAVGRFPAQQPLEILDALLAFVASELAIDPTTIQAYAQRRQTISAHQEHVRLYLGSRWFGPTERERLSAFVC